MSAIESGTADVRSQRRASSLVDSATGIIAIVLTILGLLYVAPVRLVAIATIAAGVGVFVQGLSVARDYARILPANSVNSASVGGGGFAIGLIAGAATIILGILALLGLEPTNLVAAAAISLGGAIVLRIQSTTTFVAGGVDGSHADSMRGIALNEALSNTAAIQGLTGLTAVVLGILALASFVPVTLDLVAFLTLGGGLLLSSAAFGGLVISVLQRP